MCVQDANRASETAEAALAQMDQEHQGLVLSSSNRIAALEKALGEAVDREQVLQVCAHDGCSPQQSAVGELLHSAQWVRANDGCCSGHTT
jgi:hypothetical protein